MELPELQQGLEAIQQGQPAAAPQPQEAPWLNMDNMMGAYGSWFGNDAGLGEELLAQLRARGVDTQAATEAMLRELLGGLVEDTNLLQQKLSGFMTMLQQQVQQTQAVTDSIQAALDSQGARPIATEVLPPEGGEMPVMNDIPPDMGAGGEPTMPPEESNVPPAKEPPAPEEPPAEEPPAEGPATPDETAPKDKGSDVRIKDIKNYTLSDAAMKNVKLTMAERKKQRGNALSNNILAACQQGF